MTADRPLDHRTAIVTGAASGIGRAIALRLAQAGAHVICVDRDHGRVGKLGDEIASAGGRADARTLDIQDRSAMEAFWTNFADGKVQLDVLINNAGISPAPVRLHEISDADWERCIAVNLTAAFRCLRSALAIMRRQRSGAVVNISSVAGLRGLYPGFPVLGAAYSASKAAIAGLTRQAAAEYAGDNIRINAIAPGWIAGTGLGNERRAAATAAENEQFLRTLQQRIPQGRLGTPGEIAELTLFLAGPGAGYLTGQVIAEDGGFTA